MLHEKQKKERENNGEGRKKGMPLYSFLELHLKYT